MSNAIVSNVYRYVIDDVINQVRGDFEDMGIDDSILQELQRSWESKVARSRVANFGFKDNGYYDEENGTNTTVLADTTQASHTPIVNPNDPPTLQYPSNTNNNSSDYAHQLNTTSTPSAASLANLAATASSQANRTLPPHHQHQHQGYGLPPPQAVNRMIPDPSTLVNQYQMMPHSNNTAKQGTLPDLQLPGIARPNLPQNDGGNDMTTEEIDQHIHDMIQPQQEVELDISFTASTSTGEPLALDSLPESVKALIRDAKNNKQCQRLISQLDGEATDEQQDGTAQTANEDDINSDLDDSDDDDDKGEGGEEIEHIILCLYDKVTRTKNKWKCILKDGIMLVNGRDYLFHRANGDFEW